MTITSRRWAENVTRLVIAVALWEAIAPTVLAQTIVWSDENSRRIQRKDVGGGLVTTIAQFPAAETAYYIQFDPIAAKIYYQHWPTGFERADVDGSDPELIPTASAGPFAINVESRKLYWSLGFDDVLNYSDLDGGGAQSHTYPLCCLTPLLAIGEHVYLGGSAGVTKGIWRADADGSNEQLLHAGDAPLSATYDPVDDKIYVAETLKIYRINPDGSGFEVVVPLPTAPSLAFVVIDAKERKLYWTDNTVQAIQRSNLDGSNIETFVSAAEAGNPQLELVGMTIIHNSTPIPALSGWGVLVTGLTVLAMGLMVLKRRARTFE